MFEAATREGHKNKKKKHETDFSYFLFLFKFLIGKTFFFIYIYQFVLLIFKDSFIHFLSQFSGVIFFKIHLLLSKINPLHLDKDLLSKSNVRICLSLVTLIVA